MRPITNIHELKTGNYIKFFYSEKPLLVDVKILNNIYCLSKSDDFQNPYFFLKITEQLLRDFGFKKGKDKDCLVYLKTYGRGVNKRAFVITQDADGNWFVIAKDKIIVKYAHRLQNLFFELTNYELNLKQ